MAVNAPPPAVDADAKQIRTEWVAELERLAADIERWAAAKDWAVRRQRKTLVEEPIGHYEVPVMTVQTPFGRVHFNPIARFVLGVDGRVDVYAEPSFAQLLLLRSGGEWQFLTEDLVRLNKSWSELSFREVVSDLPVAS